MYTRNAFSLLVLISVAINLIECKDKAGPADNEPRIVPLRPMKTVGMPSDVEPIPKFYLVPHNSGAIAVKKVAVKTNNNNNQNTGSTQSGGQKKKKCNHQHKNEEKAGGGGGRRGNEGGEDEGGPEDGREEGDSGERQSPKTSRIYSENPRIREFFDRFSLDVVEKADGYY